MLIGGIFHLGLILFYVFINIYFNIYKPKPKPKETMLGTGFELKQHSLFLPLSMPSFPIIPSASAISFSQFQTKNNAVGKEATKKSNSINHQNSTVSVNKRRHSKSYLERQSAILQLSSSSSQSHFDSALARYFILFNSSFFYLFFFFGSNFSQVIKRHIIWVLLLMPI